MSKRTREFLSAFLFTLFVVACVLLGVGLTPAQQWHYTGSPGRVTYPGITEASGMAASWRNPGLWWVINDGGNNPDLWAIRTDGYMVCNYRPAGVANRDWEDIAVGPGPGGLPHVYVADTGTNGAARTEVVLYRIPEPAVRSGGACGTLLGAVATRLRYPVSGTAPDAEAMLVDPDSGDLAIISKDGRIWWAPASRLGPGSVQLQLAAVLPIGGWTAADISWTGELVAVRTSTHAWVWRRARDPQAAVVRLRWEPQGEALAFSVDGCEFLTLSEGLSQPLYRFSAVWECWR